MQSQAKVSKAAEEWRSLQLGQNVIDIRIAQFLLTLNSSNVTDSPELDTALQEVNSAPKPSDCKSKETACRVTERGLERRTSSPFDSKIPKSHVRRHLPRIFWQAISRSRLTACHPAGRKAQASSGRASPLRQGEGLLRSHELFQQNRAAELRLRCCNPSEGSIVPVCSAGKAAGQEGANEALA